MNEKDLKLPVAAHYFATVSQDINKIADTAQVSKRTIRRWAETPEWELALNIWGYEGDRSFETQPKRDTKRDAGKRYNNAKTVYIAAIKVGHSPRKAPTITEQKTGIPRRRVRVWADKYHWYKTTG